MPSRASRSHGRHLGARGVSLQRKSRMEMVDMAARRERGAGVTGSSLGSCGSLSSPGGAAGARAHARASGRGLRARTWPRSRPGAARASASAGCMVGWRLRAIPSAAGAPRRRMKLIIARAQWTRPGRCPARMLGQALHTRGDRASPLGGAGDAFATGRACNPGSRRVERWLLGHGRTAEEQRLAARASGAAP